MERLKDLFELFISIKAQTYSCIETVFVAEQSKKLHDQIQAYAREEGIPNMVIFNCGQSGISVARNLGAKHASGEILAFVDDDVLLFPDWAEQMVKSYDDTRVVGVTGPAYPLWQCESVSWLPRELHWLIGCSTWCRWNTKREVRNAWGMNMSFKREAFKIVGGFSTEIGGIQGRRLHGEEVDLSLRIKRKTGGKIVYTPLVRVKHKVHAYRLSPWFIARSSYWMGFTRHQLKSLFSMERGDPLDTEHQLARQILMGLLPKTIRSLLDNPIVALRKLQLTVFTLFFVAVGYYRHLFANLQHRSMCPSRSVAS